MPARFIINQDRDQVTRFDPSKPLYITTVLMEGRPVAVNLMMSTRLLGTFDKPSEAVQEVDNIYNDKSECYAIGGFSNYDGAADLMDTLKETEGALSEMD